MYCCENFLDFRYRSTWNKLNGKHIRWNECGGDNEVQENGVRSPASSRGFNSNSVIQAEITLTCYWENQRKFRRLEQIEKVKKLTKSIWKRREGQEFCLIFAETCLRSSIFFLNVEVTGRQISDAETMRKFRRNLSKHFGLKSGHSSRPGEGLPLVLCLRLHSCIYLFKKTPRTQNVTLPVSFHPSKKFSLVEVSFSPWWTVLFSHSISFFPYINTPYIHYALNGMIFYPIEYFP